MEKNHNKKMDFLHNWLFSNTYKKYENVILNDNGTFITGSYVYKYYIRGERVDNINVVSVEYINSNRKAKSIIHELPECRPREIWADNGSLEDDYGCLKCNKFYINNIDIKIMSQGYFIGRIKAFDGISFINALKLTKNGIEDIGGNDERKKFVIRNLQNKKYCKFKNMRLKDKQYFNNFEQIDPEECVKYGFYG